MHKYIIFILCLIVFFACRRDDDILTDPGIRLTFSKDTLLFDTVFTELGSATQILKVYNPNDQAVEVTRINIKGGNNTFFRLNVDGIAGNVAENVKIRANDSIYIFGEVTIDPDNPLSVSPFVIDDAIVFELNGNTQEVPLQAWGQNANYIPNTAGGGDGIVYSCNFGDWVWDDPKPYVIFGILVIEDCNLVIPEGTQVYVHGGLARFTDQNDMVAFYNDGRIIINTGGSIQVNGSKENPVTFQGDRLESAFDDIPGQWYGIILTGNSQGNSITYAEIKNSALGVAVDSATQLTLKNTSFANISNNAILGIHADIHAENCLVYGTLSTGVNLLYGGNYDFTYCTFASYGADADALSVSNALCLDAFCQEFRSNPVSALFKNCIITGSRKDEITLFDRTETDGDFTYSFENCIVKIEELDDNEPWQNFFDFCNPCTTITPDDNLFANRAENDYHLDTLSIAEEMAMPIPNITIDLEGESRDAVMPDIGCYEYR